MTIDPLASLLIGAFGAAVLTVGGGLFGAWIQSRREHARWLREERLGAYESFLISAESMLAYRADQSAQRADDLMNTMHASAATARLLGPDSVFAAIVAHEQSCQDLLYATLQITVEHGGRSALLTDAERERLSALRSKSLPTRRALVEEARHVLGISGKRVEPRIGKRPS